MRIIHSANELKPEGKKCCGAIGFFDGVHLGHQQIIRQTISDARQHEGLSIVITFDRHPNTIVAPDRVPPMIYSLDQKVRTIARLGPDVLLLLHFDKPFSQQSPDIFIRNLVQDFGCIQSLCVGANFTFGHKRAGNIALLNQLGAELNFRVHGMAAVSLDRKPVSSTRIREAIIDGNFDAADQMLGRPWALAGKVVQGDRLGHQLGFPTANLDASGLVLPPNGVYAAHTRILNDGSIGRSAGTDGGIGRAATNPPASSGRSGESYRAVLNIGIRPTIKTGTPERRVEAHLLDFSGDLYGQELELTFVQKLRAEQKFDSLDGLKAQIVKDIEKARTIF